MPARNAGFRLVGGVAAASALAVLTYRLWRPWCLHWGASDAEVTRALPGDELLTDADLVTTRAIGIDAPASLIWPWLVQMGPGRGGAYTYDWIENLARLNMHSANKILPEFQDTEVGDGWRLGAKGAFLRVASLMPRSSLVLRSDDSNWVWIFALAPEGDTTRLVSRNRVRLSGASSLARLAMHYLMEPGSLVMERKMLLGIKQRAEGLVSPLDPGRTPSTPGPVRRRSRRKVPGARSTRRPST